MKCYEEIENFVARDNLINLSLSSTFNELYSLLTVGLINLFIILEATLEIKIHLSVSVLHLS